MRVTLVAPCWYVSSSAVFSIPVWRYPTIGLGRSTVSPSSSIMGRRAPRRGPRAPAGPRRSRGRTRTACRWTGACGRSPGPRSVLELHRDPPHGEVLAQGVAFPVLGHEDPGQVGVTGEPDAVHIEGLALHGLGTEVEVPQRRHHGVVLGYLYPHAHAP